MAGPNLGAILDAIFKAPFEDFVHTLEGQATADAAPLVQKAASSAAALTQLQAASIEAKSDLATAVEAVVDPLVNVGIAAVSSAVPVLGPMLAGTLDGPADQLANAALAALIDKLTSFLPKL